MPTMATIAAVVQELEFENIRIEDPPAAMYVASLQCVLVSGEFMIFTEPIIHLGVSHPCGLILGVGLSSRRLSMQLLRPSDMPCIRAPLDRTYLVYPPEVALTNLVVEVEVARILGAAFVFSVASNFIMLNCSALAAASASYCASLRSVASLNFAMSRLRTSTRISRRGITESL
jgi:hypothetical protein